MDFSGVFMYFTCEAFHQRKFKKLKSLKKSMFLSASTSPRCLLGSHRRVPMLHLWMRWKCLMPLVTHLLDEWGDIQFLFPNFPWMRFQWEKFHNNLSIGFMTWMCHFVDASWVLGTWSAGHGGWWFHVRSFERHVFVGFIDGHVIL